MIWKIIGRDYELELICTEEKFPASGAFVISDHPMLSQNVAVQAVNGHERLIALQAWKHRHISLVHFVSVRHMLLQQLLRRCPEIAMQALHSAREMGQNVIFESRSGVRAVAAKVADVIFNLIVNVLDVLLQAGDREAADWTNLTGRRED